MSGAYANTGAKSLGSNRTKRARKAKKMKLTWKQRLRNWLMKDGDEAELAVQEPDVASLSSEGMRFHLYRAAGGFVVETRQYDHKNDRSYTKLYIVRDDQDVGEEIGKIITIESLR